ncbi:serine/threonine protein kinase [Pendulispora brunnea]|uniref:Serine/threonine protein kinase n=1 Tax=Pendulispora brunnea TaxID=2905690 RepID=A0ABZ2K387_9BACT
MATPDEHLIGPGHVLLGKYRVERVLGHGGMGLVVSARHLTLEDRVAIKLLLPKHAENSDLVQRFLREARAAVRIRSQHVARVTDVGTLDYGGPYMVMEYLDGSDLAVVLEQNGPMPIHLAVDFVLQALEALAEAHSLGIVHRDVKPGNLFLTRHADGAPCVKVLDFGISKVLQADDQSLTRAGGMLGSPLYMAPEQLESARDVDARADVYSMGVVLFELLTQQRPFNAGDLPRLLYKVLNEERPPARSVRADIPPALDQVILTAMARDRGHRYPSVAEFALALLPFGSNQARASVERICGVLGVSAAQPAYITSAQPGPPRTHHVSTISAAITPVAAARTSTQTMAEPAKARSRGPLAAVIGAGAGLVLGSLLLIGLVSRAHRPEAPSSGAAAPPKVEEPAPPPSGAAPEPAKSASEPAAAAAVPSASASAAAASDDAAKDAKKKTSTSSGRSAKPGGSSSKPDPFKRDIF